MAHTSNRSVTETNDASLNLIELVMLVHELFHLFLAVAQSNPNAFRSDKPASMFTQKLSRRQLVLFPVTKSVLRSKRVVQ